VVFGYFSKSDYVQEGFPETKRAGLVFIVPIKP
jgi:hypothetical protein